MREAAHARDTAHVKASLAENYARAAQPSLRKRTADERRQAGQTQAFVWSHTWSGSFTAADESDDDGGDENATLIPPPHTHTLNIHTHNTHTHTHTHTQMGHTHHWAQAMDPRLMPLEEENKAFVKKYTPKNTTEAYEGQLKFFDAYLQEEGLKDLASDPVVLCNVLIRKQKAGAAHNTCKLLRSAVGSRFKHAKQNPSDSMKVTEVMSRIKAATPPKKEYREVPRALLWRVAAAAEQEVAAAIIAGHSLAAFRALGDKTLMLSSFATWS